jgi:hypothetical protein
MVSEEESCKKVPRLWITLHGSSVDINILCRLFQHKCHQRAVFQGLNRYRGAESVVLLFSTSTYPRMATSTVDKETDRDNHY